MHVLTEHQLFAKYSKCEFRLRSFAFAGHIVSSEGLEIDSKKTEAVQNCPRLLTPTIIQSFLG